MIVWDWLRFEEFSLEALYESLALRQKVFVTGQNCAYLDADNNDQPSMHLLGWHSSKAPGNLRCYLRVLPPGLKYKELSIGRVLCADGVRGRGWGRQLMREALKRCEQSFGLCDIRISAQAYLKKFYEDFGFECVSDAYLEDNIPHYEMLRKVK